MATLGKTTTPSTPTFGWINNNGWQVAMLFTTTQSGLYSSVTFWAAGNGTQTIHGVIWDGSGSVLAFGPGVSTSGGVQSGVGATQWYTDTFSSPVFIASGTSVFIGWQPDTSSPSTSWAYNGNDASPDAVMHSGSAGSSGLPLAPHSTESPNGAVAAYATYTPSSLYVNTGTPASPVWTAASGVYVNTGTPASPVWTAASEIAINTGTPGSPVWTPGA